MFSREIFANRLKEQRLLKGVTQSALAEAIGTKKQSINDMEHGRTTTSLEKLWEIAKFFDISADYLLGLTDNPAVNE